MNLAEALNSSFTELPPPSQAARNPRLHPGVIAREHKEPDGSYMVAMGTHRRSKILYLSMAQWQAMQLLNGKRSYEQVAAIMKSRGIAATADNIRSLVDDLDKWGFWYKTPQEESVTLMEKLAETRRERTKKRGAIDWYKVELVSWDADQLFGKLLKWINWAYSPWFTVLTVLGFAFMAYIWLSNWGQLWEDSAAYWNFTEKGLLDILEFYFIFGIIAFIHECGHGITAKHFGAEVHRLGFMLVYTVPAAFVDSGQVWLYHGRFERCATIIAGMWVEMIVCVIATVIWWGTAVGGVVHDLAYKVVLIGGILPLIINLNPLIRLDGYLFLSEMIRTPALKQKSVAYLSALVRRHIFRLPVTVPVYPLRRRILYGTYAALSGAYSYLVMLFLARITYRIALHISPDWAFLPASLVALAIFKSRILKLRDFLRTLYLDKKELMRTHRKPLLAAASVAVVLLVLPLRHESISAQFLLEPAQRAVIRTEVPGRVMQVTAKEGDQIAAGAPLVWLRNLGVETEAAEAGANYRSASAHAVQAQLGYADYASAAAERQAAVERVQTAGAQQQRLSLTSPISGIVVTPRLGDLVGAYLSAGTLVAEVDDVSRMQARVFVPEADLRVLGRVSDASLRVPSRVLPYEGLVVSVSPSEQEVAPGLEATTKIKGFGYGPHYAVTIQVSNDGRLLPGMSGTAKIFGRRRSLAGLMLQPLLDFLGRKFW